MTVLNTLEATKMPGCYETMGKVEKGSGDTINIPEIGLNIGGIGNGFYLEAETNIDPENPANRDDSFTSLTLGDDINLYALKPTSSNLRAVPQFSKNSTFPNGSNAEGSRKICGFHYGRIRNSITIADVSTGIVPNAIWDLKNGPKCDPAGMADSGAGFWFDLYTASLFETIVFNNGTKSQLISGKAQSKYGSTPLAGTEGLSGDNFVELAAMTNKRLLTLPEWRIVAKGSPQGNDGDNVNAWTAVTNSARTTCGAVVNAISLLNAVDCVGNLHEWLNEFGLKTEAGTTWAWQNPYPGLEVGDIHMKNLTGLSQLVAGLSWHHGVHAGSRSLNVHPSLWEVGPDIGSRFACDSL